MPQISVIMPAYNAENYIGDAIESILKQTFTNFEFIIINDGSTDNTKRIIRTYNDSRIILLENEKNRGIVKTLNRGLNVAKGKFIARMDADDIAIPERLEIQKNYLEEHPEIAVLGTGIQVFGNGIESYDRIFTTNSDQLKAELIFNSCIAHPTVMIRKSVLDENKLHYDERCVGAEDYFLWWELSKKAKIATLPNILHKYRIHGKQVTQNKNESQQKMMCDLLEYRLSDMKVDLEEEEKKVLLAYCMADFHQFNKENFEEFENALLKILNINKKTNMFSKKALHQVCELAIIFSLKNSDMELQDQKKEYKKAVQKGIFTPMMRLKTAYHHTF